MTEVRAPISSSRIAAGDVARHSFAVVRRGYETDEVRTYLQSVARTIEELEAREHDLRKALSAAEERAAHPVIDEAMLTASLGQHSTQILRHAHEEAANVVAQAQQSAGTLLRDAQKQVEELQTRAETSNAAQVREVELLVANAETEARAQGERILADTKAECEELVSRAKDEGRALLEQAQEARRRILADMASRRRTLGVQIEQLRAARSEMAASIYDARQKVDEILGQLESADKEARAAALAAGDHARMHGPDLTHDQDAGNLVGEAPVDRASTAGADTTVTGVVDGEVAVRPPAEHATDVLSSAPSVDDLFARIRAGTEEAASEDPEHRSETPTAEEAPGDEAAADESSSGHAALVERRDELIGPVTVRLNRGMKRALGDDQNRLLDQLRSAPSTAADELIGSEDDHVAAYVAAARGHLGEAFGAGAAFVGGEAGSVGADAAVDEAATALARAVVTALRRRVADGEGEPADRVGVAFREWRGERVERLVGDSVTQAFSAGVVGAAGPDRKVRWVLTRPGGCSDCDDNALAGAVAPTESFPTGHAHPPAHAGCRCLVALTDD